MDIEKVNAQEEYDCRDVLVEFRKNICRLFTDITGCWINSRSFYDELDGVEKKLREVQEEVYTLTQIYRPENITSFTKIMTAVKTMHETVQIMRAECDQEIIELLGYINTRVSGMYESVEYLDHEISRLLRHTKNKKKLRRSQSGSQNTCATTPPPLPAEGDCIGDDDIPF